MLLASCPIPSAAVQGKEPGETWQKNLPSFPLERGVSPSQTLAFWTEAVKLLAQDQPGSLLMGCVTMYPVLWS